MVVDEAPPRWMTLPRGAKLRVDAQAVQRIDVELILLHIDRPILLSDPGQHGRASPGIGNRRRGATGDRLSEGLAEDLPEGRPDLAEVGEEHAEAGEHGFARDRYVVDVHH